MMFYVQVLILNAESNVTFLFMKTTKNMFVQ